MATTVRIPLRLEEALAQYCVENHRSKSEVIIELLTQRLVAEEHEKTPYEIACETGFIGSLTPTEYGSENMAENAKERVKSAITQKHARQATE